MTESLSTGTPVTSVTLRGALPALDQIASSLSNVLLTVLLARRLSPSAFGGLAIILALLVMLMAASQVAVGDTFLIRHLGDRVSAGDALGAAFLNGLLGAVLLGIVSFATGVPTLPGLILVLGSPALFLGDSGRLVAIGLDKAGWALLGDVLWVCVVAVALFVPTSADAGVAAAQMRKTQDGGTVGVFTEVTELKRREEELAAARDEATEAQRQLVDAIESISEGFSLYDADDKL